MTSHGTGSSKHGRSKKLDRTLKELESAFSDWESLNGEAPPPSPEAQSQGEKAKVDEKEFRRRTKMLLTQLREQLADLND